MGGSPEKGELPDAWGEVPQNPGELPLVRDVQDVPNPKTLKKNAIAFLDSHPELEEKLRRVQHEVVLHGNAIIIGVGAAAMFAGAVHFLYRRHRDKENKG